jgi:hypothetical protein
MKKDNEVTISVDKLKELKKKLHLIGGHTFAAYASFYARNMEQAQILSKESEEAFDDLVSDFEDLINDIKL